MTSSLRNLQEEPRLHVRRERSANPRKVSSCSRNGKGRIQIQNKREDGKLDETVMTVDPVPDDVD
jgi:hypothetical protein